MIIQEALYSRRSCSGALTLFISRVARYTPSSPGEHLSKIFPPII